MAPPKVYSGRTRLAIVVLYFATVASLLPDVVHWDGVGFLIRSFELHNVDFAHVLYAPALRLAHLVTAPLGASPELAARLFSVVGAALVLFLFWLRSERAGLSSGAALACAGLLVTTPLVWRQAGVIDPGTWMIASLLLAAAAADAYGRTRAAGPLALACAALALAVGFHLLAVVALPWLVFRAWGTRGAPRPLHALVPVAFLSASALVLALVGVSWGELREFFVYGRGFVPELESVEQTTRVTGSHVRDAAAFFGEGAPVLLGLAVVGLPFARDRRSLWSIALLAVPYLAAFAFLGRPFVGLLMPVFLALGALVVTAAASRDTRVVLATGRRAPRRAVRTVLAVALTLQVALSAPEVVERTTQVDEKETTARLLADAAPPWSTVFAGPLALHMRWVGRGIQVVALPDVIHLAEGESGQDVDRTRAVLDEVRRRSAKGRQVFITWDGLQYLERRFDIEPGSIVPAGSKVIRVRDEPPLLLVRLAGSDLDLQR